MKTNMQAGCAVLLASAAGAWGSVTNVYVHSMDFSINSNPNAPMVDAIIEAGDTIHWQFLTPFHTVTSCENTGEDFASDLVFTLPASFEHTFNTPGTFHYFCIVHGFDNGDGTGGGMAGVITVLPPAGPVCDSIDFNGDGLFPDTLDIDDFLSVFAGGACSTGTCGDIDFNNDGLFPDTTDIDSLLSVFAGGPCL